LRDLGIEEEGFGARFFNSLIPEFQNSQISLEGEEP
jgi:hypothetical protein